MVLPRREAAASAMVMALAGKSSERAFSEEVDGLERLGAKAFEDANKREVEMRDRNFMLLLMLGVYLGDLSGEE